MDLNHHYIIYLQVKLYFTRLQSNSLEPFVLEKLNLLETKTILKQLLTYNMVLY